MSYTSPTNPLATIYTIDAIVKTIAQWLKQESQEELDLEFIKTLVNIAILNVSETISGAGGDDYYKSVVIANSSSSVSAIIVTGRSYTDATKTISSPSHGFTSADIGKRIALWNGTTKAMIATIASITDTNFFTIDQAFGADIAGTVSYSVFSQFSDTSINLSSYPILDIIKITDSINKEVVFTSAKSFDNLSRFPEKQNKIYYTKLGQFLFFFIGTSISAVGTWTMWYNSYPQKVMNDGDYVDIRDSYVPLVIELSKQYCLQHLNINVPDTITQAIENKTASMRDNILKRQALTMQKSE